MPAALLNRSFLYANIIFKGLGMSSSLLLKTIQEFDKSLINFKSQK